MLRLLSFDYGNPHLVFCILWVRIQINFQIRSAAIFVSGGGQPFSDNSLFQFLNRQVGARSRKDGPGRSGNYKFCLLYTSRCV